jgi:hypothetical protein
MIDARKPSSFTEEIADLGLNIDQGMAVKYQDTIYFGADALHILALLSTQSNLFNLITHWIFKSKLLARAVYPLMRNVRHFILWFMRIPLINTMNQR